MNVIEKIDNLRKERGWSYYKLSTTSELTPSTITNMLLRKTQPSLKTLTAICKAFGITLSEFFDENNGSTNYTIEEKNLIGKYRNLNPKEKEAVMTFIEKLQ